MRANIKKFRRLSRNLLPWFIFNPLVNIARLLKFLWGPTNDSAELSRLHETALKAQKTFDNIEKIANEPLPNTTLTQQEQFRLAERQIFSQGGEDGVLLHIFRNIGVTNKFFVEFGAGGKTSVTLNLVVNHGWSGLMMDGNQQDLDRMKNLISLIPFSNKMNIHFKKAWVTKENINELIGETKKGEIDLLSIDIDGNDYYVWEAIDVVSPRVVLIEYNASFGEQSLTVEYDQSFDFTKYHSLGWFHGASLSALHKLGQKKGYSLVTCDSKGVNAFFIRNDCLSNKFLPLLPLQGFYRNDSRTRIAPLEVQQKEIQKFPTVSI